MKIKGPQIAAIAAFSVTVIVVALVWQARTRGPQTEDFLASVRENTPQATAAPAPLNSLPGRDTDPSLVPIIELDSREFDMGLISNKKLTTRDVLIHNRGKAPLRIRSIKTECGCTTGRMVKDVIPPGETGVMRVTLDPRRVPGFRSSKTLTLFSNDPKRGPIQLKVLATIQNEIELDPDRTLDFGDVSRGNPVEEVLVVRQVEDTPFNILEVKPFGDNAPIKVSFEERPKESWRNPGKKEYLIKVALAIDAPIGPINSRFDIFSDLKRVPRLPRYVKANVTSFYKVSPKFVMLRNIAPGQTRERIITVFADRPFEVIAAPFDRQEISLAKRPGQQPNSYVFDLTLSPDAAPGPVRETLKLTIKEGGHEFTETINLVVIAVDSALETELDDLAGTMSKTTAD